MRRRATAVLLAMLVIGVAFAAGGSPVGGQGYPPGPVETTVTTAPVATTAPEVTKAPEVVTTIKKAAAAAPAVVAGIALTGANILKIAAVALALIILGTVFVRSARGRADQA